MRSLRKGKFSGAAVVLAMVGAGVIGCGGNGGDSPQAYGYSNTGTTAGNVTAGNPANSTGDPTTTGTMPGTLPKNVIFYDLYNEKGDREFRYISPTGSDDKLFVTLPPDFDAFAPNPTKPNEVYFAAREKDGTKLGIYRNSSISLSGATSLIGPTYVGVSGMQVSNNGRFLAFNAAVGDENLRLFVLDLQSPTSPAIIVDEADYFHVSPDVRKIVYAKQVDGESHIFVRDFPAGTKATDLTADAKATNLAPQFNKDSNRIVFTSDRDSTGAYDLWAINADGKDLRRLTNTPDDIEFGASWNAEGTEVAYGVASGVAENNGLCRKPLDGDRVVLKQVVGINETRWTGANGKSNTLGANIGLNAKKKKVEDGAPKPTEEPAAEPKPPAAG